MNNYEKISEGIINSTDFEQFKIGARIMQDMAKSLFAQGLLPESTIVDPEINGGGVRFEHSLFVFDRRSKEFSVNGVVKDIEPGQRRLLELFTNFPDMPLAYKFLESYSYFRDHGSSYASPNLRAMVSRLNTTIRSGRAVPNPIIAVTAFGYKLTDPLDRMGPKQNS